MFYNLDNISIDFVKNYRTEQINMPTNELYNYSIFDQAYLQGKYLQADFNRKDQICYIRIKNSNLWLYKTSSNKTIPLYLHKHKNYFDVDQPLVCWIKYDDYPIFAIYVYLTDQLFPSYLVYDETNITFNWTYDIGKSTMFQFN